MNAISSIRQTDYRDYGRFASGKRVQSAADDAAALSIIEKEEAQLRGQRAGQRNIGSGQDLLNVADGGMAGITDYLQSIRELAVQAANSAVMSDSDRSAIQAQIDQYKKGISDLASQTSFNTKNLLDGSTGDLNIATDSDGGSIELSTGDATLDALGIADFDVTGDFDIQDIDDALAKVTSSRSQMGAQYNALGYAYNYSTNASLNLSGAQSRLEDLDYPQAISDIKKKQTLQEYAFYMRKQFIDQQAGSMRMLMMM